MSENTRVMIIGEIGINHNGDLGTALELIKMAWKAGFDAVKFQKRTPELYPERPYNSPLFGETTYREHKRRLEFGKEEYDAIADWCKQAPIKWFAACFDKASVDFISEYNPEFWKIPSPAIHDHELIDHIGGQEGMVLMSTGMSTISELDKAVKILRYSRKGKPFALLHCCSEYPTPLSHVNLRNIPMLRERYYTFVGYSSHDAGVPCSVGAVALGAKYVEVHITLDRAMKGSDHAASLEYEEMERLCRHIRGVEEAMGDDLKHFYPGELIIRDKVAQNRIEK